MQPKLITQFFSVQPLHSPAKPGQVTQVEHYSDLEFMEKVGGGGYGTVSKGRWISRDKIVAIKTLIVFDEREVNHRVVYCKNYNNFASPVLNILLGCSYKYFLNAPVSTGLHSKHQNFVFTVSLHSMQKHIYARVDKYWRHIWRIACQPMCSCLCEDDCVSGSFKSVSS